MEDKRNKLNTILLIILIVLILLLGDFYIYNTSKNKNDNNKTDNTTTTSKIDNSLNEELDGSTVAKFATVQKEGDREVIREIEYYNLDLEGKNAVIIGRSNLVGKPLIELLLRKNATVTVCHSKTPKLKKITKKADIIIAAVGRKNLITKDMIKRGCIVIDVGINRVDNKICGDVDFKNVQKKASYITPVPGGVGPMTVAMLFYNLIKKSDN